MNWINAQTDQHHHQQIAMAAAIAAAAADKTIFVSTVIDTFDLFEDDIPTSKSNRDEEKRQMTHSSSVHCLNFVVYVEEKS